MTKITSKFSIASAFAVVCILALGNINIFVSGSPLKLMCGQNKPCTMSQGENEIKIQKIHCIEDVQKCHFKFIRTTDGNMYFCRSSSPYENHCKFMASVTSDQLGDGIKGSHESNIPTSDFEDSSASFDGDFEKRSLPFETLNYGKRGKPVVYFVGKRSE